jgi:hypothetical protein
MSDGKPYVVIATPCYGGMVTQTFMVSVMRLIEHCYAPSAGFRITVVLHGNDALISRGRSTLLAAFLDFKPATHLLFIDADIGFDPEQVARLLAFDRDFVAALYPLKMLDWQGLPPGSRPAGANPLEPALHYCATLCEGADRVVERGFATALYAGGGFQLIKRGALERMTEAYPELRYKSIHAHRYETDPDGNRSMRTDESANQYALFDSLIEPETGVYLSEDYAFCWRWRRLGGQIWVDLESKLLHVGPFPFQGDTTARFRGLSGSGVAPGS